MDHALAIEVAAMSRSRAIAEVTARGDSPVQQFYSDAVIFLTGGSGFLGKQLIDKLFRSCEIKKIFLLLRQKKSKPIADRVNTIFNDAVFDTVRKSKPNFMDKIVPVEGDVTELRLGISDENWKMITNEVTVIIHGAATINFVENLKTATLTNVRGTREMLRLGHECKNLKSFVHISTAYSHTTQSNAGKQLHEKFYPCPVPPSLMIDLAEQLDEEKLHEMTPQFIDVWPNTYSFTKAVAEETVRTMAGDLPICIVRPAIVISSNSEPMPGWLDRSGRYGPSGFIFGIGLGVLHVTYAIRKGLIDLVPVDFVNNVVITAGYETAMGRERKESPETNIPIYAVTGSRNPLLIDNMVKLVETKGRQVSSTKALWYTYALVVEQRLIMIFLKWFLHYIPAYIVDAVLLLLGKTPRAVKEYDNAFKHVEVFEFYLTNSWEHTDTNYLEMYRGLTPIDRAIYHSDMADLDWKHYITIWCLGIRKYLLRDELKNTDKALKKQKYLKVANAVFIALYVTAIWKLVVFLCGIVFSVFSYIFN